MNFLINESKKSKQLIAVQGFFYGEPGSMDIAYIALRHANITYCLDFIAIMRHEHLSEDTKRMFLDMFGQVMSSPNIRKVVHDSEDLINVLCSKYKIYLSTILELNVNCIIFNTLSKINEEIRREKIIYSHFSLNFRALFEPYLSWIPDKSILNPSKRNPLNSYLKIKYMA